MTPRPLNSDAFAKPETWPADPSEYDEAQDFTEGAAPVGPAHPPASATPGAAPGGVWDAARSAAWVAAWAAAARDAALALSTRDLITPEQFDTLYGPWREVIG